MIGFACASCQRQFSVPDDRAGGRFVCPDCGLIAEVPVPPVADAPGSPGWFHIQDKRKAGPVSLTELRQLIAAGRLWATDMVLQQGATKWTAAESVFPRSQAPLGNASPGSSASPSDPGPTSGDLQAKRSFADVGSQAELGNQGTELGNQGRPASFNPEPPAPVPAAEPIPVAIPILPDWADENKKDFSDTSVALDRPSPPASSASLLSEQSSAGGAPWATGMGVRGGGVQAETSRFLHGNPPPGKPTSFNPEPTATVPVALPIPRDKPAWWQRLLQESRQSAADTGAQTVRLVRYAAGHWRRRSAQRSLQRAQLALGMKMYETRDPRSQAPLGNASPGSSASPSDPGPTLGDLQAKRSFADVGSQAELGNQGKSLTYKEIAAVEERIRQAQAAHTSVKLLAKERRRLLMLLAAPALEEELPPDGADPSRAGRAGSVSDRSLQNVSDRSLQNVSDRSSPVSDLQEHRQARECQAALRAQDQALLQARAALLPTTGAGRLRVLAGYAAAACMIFLVLALYPHSPRSQAPLSPRSQAPLGNASPGSSASPSDPGPTSGDLQAKRSFADVGSQAELGNQRDQGDSAIPADAAVLELQVPPGTRVEIDGKDIGDRRRHRFTGMDPKQLQQRTATMRFPDGKEVKRTLLVRGGEVLRLALPGPDMPRHELVLQTGHTSVINAVAFSPDGKQVLTGSRDNTAVLWDAASGQKLRAFQGHTRSVNAVAINPDGTQVLTGSSDETAVLWDAASGQKLRTFQGHTHWVQAVAFSPDGKQVLTGSHDKTAALWDADSGQKLRAFQGHIEEVHAVAFSPDGKQVLTGSYDNTVVLWDAASGQKLRAFQGHTNDVEAVAFSPDGKQILTGSDDKTAVLWDAANGQKLRAFQGHTDKVAAVAFSPDGKQVLTGSVDKTAVLWDTANGQKLRAFQGHTDWVNAVTFSPDGKQVLTGGDTKAVLWDAADVQKLRAFQGHTGSVEAVAISSDGRQVLTGSWNKTAVLWDAVSGQKLRTFQGHTGCVGAVAFSPDGKQVLTGSQDQTVVLWDAASGHKLRDFQGHTCWVSAVTFSPKGRQIVTGSADGTTRLWDVASGDELARLINIDASKDWAVVTPEGLFDGSKSGREKCFYRMGNTNNIVPLDRFFQDFYYPSLLAAIWRGERPMPGKAFQISPAPSIKLLVQNQKSEVRGQGPG